MKVYIAGLMLFTIGLTLSSAQEPRIQIAFEVNGKEIQCKRILHISFMNQKFSVQGDEESYFQIPTDLWNYDQVKVRFQCGKNQLDFGKIYTPKFRAKKWTIGIDKRPFDADLLRGLPLPVKKIRELHYIKFESDEGDGTLVVMPIRF